METARDCAVGLRTTSWNGSNSSRAAWMRSGALAVGTVLTWLLAGPFGHMLEETLPHHHLHAHTTLEIVEDILTAPATYLALAVVALGLAAWWFRALLAP